ncbi:tyrosine serine protein phosphatase [Geosmithia morbida]|uniref:Tyrosine serine protein phosphatase n=1 Tax=Geosmithia morbida TaxID=1094350 RepID=A0A9P4YRB5_9HYPO|nr:tyrosine serine protein phosphatase [Geosmithia morbida]KAF4120176.1 tyrosine serine protein phosphatase [Geosmithia morbida]
MASTDPLKVPEKVANFRDVGHTINEYLGERETDSTDSPPPPPLDDATPHDRHLILHDLGITNVVDLRTKSEQIVQERKHKAKAAATALSEQTMIEPLHIQGIQYHEIKVIGRRYERHLLSQLSWWNYIEFLFLYILGFRQHAIRIIGQQVLTPNGLFGIARGVMEHSGAEIRDVLTLYASPSTLPSIVHCTLGKDRTGLVCALVLMILGLPHRAIEHDYFLTDSHLRDQREARAHENEMVGLPREWAGTDKNMIVDIQTHLDTTYGGLDKYLDGIGFTKADRQLVRDTLLY